MNRTNFTNFQGICIFKNEMEGQISDGKYENSRPYTHWMWVCEHEAYHNDKLPYGTTRYISKRYIIHDFAKNPVLQCVIDRMVEYGRLGKTIETMFNEGRFDIDIDIANRLANSTTVGGIFRRRAYVDKEKFETFVDNLENEYCYGDVKYVHVFENENISVEIVKEVVKRSFEIQYDEKEMLKDCKMMERNINNPMYI